MFESHVDKPDLGVSVLISGLNWDTIRWTPVTWPNLFIVETVAPAGFSTEQLQKDIGKWSYAAKVRVESSERMRKIIARKEW